MENRCIICRDIIPEGREVCPTCADKAANSDFQWSPYSRSWMPKPIFNRGQFVKFWLRDGEQIHEIVGTVEIVDEFGTFEQNVEPSYDVLAKDPVTNQITLYKHMRQNGLAAV